MESPVHLNSQTISHKSNQDLQKSNKEDFRKSHREDLSEYVAHLQFHMTLQARNLVPTLTRPADSREELLQETQATFEKHVSRQSV
jgi:hypothetical protein